MKANVPQMLLRTVYINRFRRDIHIAAPESRPILREVSGKIVFQASVPFQLVLMLRSAQLVAVWDIRIDDRNAAKDNSHQTHIIDFWKLIIESVEHLIRCLSSQYSNAVIGLHAAMVKMVTGGPQNQSREHLVLAFGFLNTKYVGLVLFQPRNDGIQPDANGIHVVRG